MADHNLIKDKLSKIAQQYFDLKIVDTKKTIRE